MTRKLPGLLVFMLAAFPASAQINFQDPVYWNGGGGTWDTTNAEWSNDPTFATGLTAWDNSSGPLYSAVFNGPASSVSLTGTIAAGSITFGASGYTLTDGPLAINNGFSLDTGTGAQTISAAIVDGGNSGWLTKNGTGTLVLSGANTFTGTTVITDGTLTMTGGTLGTSTSSTIGEQLQLLNADSALNLTGGTVSVNTLNLKQGNATVSGVGTSLSLTNLYITTAGGSATGSIAFSGGATATIATADIGFGSGTGGTGSMTVDGAGTNLTFTNLTVGLSGASGTITQTGGTVTAKHLLIATSGGTSSYDLQGGTLNVGSQGITTSTGGTLRLDGGTLQAGAATLTASGPISVNAASTIDTNGDALTVSGALSGSPALTKIGAGTLILSGANSGFSGGITVTGGTLEALTNSSALGTGAITLNGGNLELVSNSATNYWVNVTIAASANLTIDRVSSTHTEVETLGNLSIGGQTLNLNLGSSKVSQGELFFGTVSLTGAGTVFNPAANAFLALTAVTDNGNGYGFTKTGAGTLDLNSNNTLSGPVALSGGTVQVLNKSFGTAAVEITQATTLQYADPATIAGSNWANNSFVIDSGAVLTTGAATGLSYDVPGTISGGGSLSITNGGSSGVTILAGVNTYTGVTTIGTGTVSVASVADGGNTSGLGASSNSAANLVLNGGTLAYTGAAGTTDRLFTLTRSGGTISVTGTGSLQLTNSGAVAFSGSGTRTLTLSGSNTGGSNELRAAIGNGTGGATSIAKSGTNTWVLSGTNTYTGTTTISAGTLAINGSTTGSAFTVKSGATLGGSGAVGTLTVNSGGMIAPGNSPGTLTASSATLAGGSIYDWQISNAAGPAGTGWDLLNVTAANGGTGILNLTGASSSNQIVLDVQSLTLGNTAGAAANFSGSQDYSFVLIQAASITGFSAGDFSVNTSGFANSAPGIWSVSESGNNLDLNYTSAVPEPSTYAVIFGAAALAFALCSPRRRSL